MNGKIFIVGAAGAGKTQFARALCASLKLPPSEVAECGDVCVKLAARYEAAGSYPLASDRSIAAWEKYIRGDKSWYRGKLRALGDILTDIDPGYFVHSCFETGAQIIVGIRRECETRSAGNGVDDRWILVTRPGALNYENDWLDVEFFKMFCSIHVENDGTPAGLAREIYRVEGILDL